MVLEEVLIAEDARRAAHAILTLGAHGLHAALAGGVARAIQLQAHGHATLPRHLNDVDLVVEGFSSLPPSLAGVFLLNHVHPSAAEGKILLQLIDEPQALRIDVFRTFGSSLSRTIRVAAVEPLQVLAVEDLRARATAMVHLHLARDRPIDPKYVLALNELDGLGDRHVLNAAWEDHRQGVAGSFADAHQRASDLGTSRPDLLVSDVYSTVIEPCDRCRVVGPLRPSPPERIVEILGYW